MLQRVTQTAVDQPSHQGVTTHDAQTETEAPPDPAEQTRATDIGVGRLSQFFPIPCVSIETRETGPVIARSHLVLPGTFVVVTNGTDQTQANKAQGQAGNPRPHDAVRVSSSCYVAP